MTRRSASSIEALKLRPTKPDWSGELGLGESPGETGALASLKTFVAEALKDLRGRARPSCAWRRVAPVGEPAFRRDLAASHRAHRRNRGGGEAGARRCGGKISGRAHAGATSQRPCSTPIPIWRRVRLRPEFERFPWRDDEDGFRRLGAWAYRLSDRRRRHAPIVANGISAQSRAPDRRFVPRQAPAHRLAAWRGMVLGHADRRRSGEQSAQLAMGRRRRASIPRPTSASSIRCCRRRSSTPTAPMCANGSRSWRVSRRPPFTVRGRPRATRWNARESC